MIEEWRDIKGYEGLYQVSNVGRVKSLKKTITYVNGRKNDMKEKILSICSDKDGYGTLGLTKNKKRYNKKVHRLVAEAFVYNKDKKPDVNHINGVKRDNNFNNLSWCTKSENTKHAIKNGLWHPPIKKGVDSGRSTLTVEDVKNIRKSIGKTLKSLSIEFKTSSSVVHRIIKNKTYTDSKYYT